MMLEYVKVSITNITRFEQVYEGYGVYSYHLMCDRITDRITEKNIYVELTSRQRDKLLKNGYYLIEKRGV